VLASGGGVLLIAAVSAALFWIQALTGFYLVREKLVRGPLRVDFSNLKNLLTLSIPLALSQFFAEATMQYPIVLARHLIEDKGVVGNIALSFQAVLVAAVIPWSLTQASMPAVMRSAARHDGRDGQFAEAMIRMAAIGGAALVVSAAWVGKPLISMLLGAEYSLAGAMLWHALLIVAPLTVAVGTRSWLIARGRYHVVALIGLAGFATLVGCAALIIPAVGPKGVYVAAGFGHLVVAAGGLVLVFREDPAVFGRHTVYSFLLACVAGAVYAVLARVNLAGIGALLAATTLVTGGFLWCLTNQEREWLIQKTAMLTGYSRRD
jgi:O-antigen/teichoic acid export membrane protein